MPQLLIETLKLGVYGSARIILSFNTVLLFLL
jgi:hypothetical protein